MKKVFKIQYKYNHETVEVYFSTATKAFQYTLKNKIVWFVYEEIKLDFDEQDAESPL